MPASASTGSADFELTLPELREVVRFGARHAQEVLPVFERDVPADPRPRAAIEAAWAFVDGGRRTTRQRTTAVQAHRAAREAPTAVAGLAGRCAGDAAAAAYLHPIARATQVGHILRAAAGAVRIAELLAGDDPAAAAMGLQRSRLRATPVLVAVLCRYPPAPAGRDRVADLMSVLDRTLRQSPDVPAVTDGPGPGWRS